jgi:hypothetical protein
MSNGASCPPLNWGLATGSQRQLLCHGCCQPFSLVTSGRASIDRKAPITTHTKNAFFPYPPLTRNAGMRARRGRSCQLRATSRLPYPVRFTGSVWPTGFYWRASWRIPSRRRPVEPRLSACSNYRCRGVQCGDFLPWTAKQGRNTSTGSTVLLSGRGCVQLRLMPGMERAPGKHPFAGVGEGCPSGAAAASDLAKARPQRSRRLRQGQRAVRVGRRPKRLSARSPAQEVLWRPLHARRGRPSGA